MHSEFPTCVIGAGISGLTTAKALAEQGIDFEVFEIGSAIGGNWRYDNDNERSAAYASLHIDTSRGRFAFSDHPMPKHWPTYLHHSQVLEYLEGYAERFALVDRITFRTEIVSVRPVEHLWDVTLAHLDTGEQETRTYEAVVVASGHHWDPNMPATEGPFGGVVVHARKYRTPEPYIGKDVVVVGAGNTGVDLASELSWHAGSVTLSTRSGAYILPRFLFGRPIDHWSSRASSGLPISVQRAIYRAMLFLARGRQESYGFPTPDSPILAQHPTVSQDLLRLVKDGQITVKPGLSRMTPDEAVFVDGSSVPCDVLIYATGYRISFPFLDEDIVATDDNRVDLYKRVVDIDHPGLYFVGLIQPVGALPPLAEQQARWVARLIGGAALPSRAAMLAEITRVRDELAERYDARDRHTIQVDYWPYLDEMRDLCDAIDASRTPASTPA
jgi:cation diffusion facilitator CzcD-associated flavoprotein CzcO